MGMEIMGSRGGMMPGPAQALSVPHLLLTVLKRQDELQNQMTATSSIMHLQRSWDNLFMKCFGTNCGQELVLKKLASFCSGGVMFCFWCLLVSFWCLVSFVQDGVMFRPCESPGGLPGGAPGARREPRRQDPTIFLGSKSGGSGGSNYLFFFGFCYFFGF